jgi:uncharacterized membrane protein
MNASDPSLDRLERNLGRLLQAGVFTAAACLALGLVAFISVGQSRFSTLTLTLGLIVLMATPIMRVVVSLVAYVRMRDWFFVTTTVTVFVLLIVTVTLAWRRAAGG